DDEDRQDLDAFAAYADGLIASEPDGVPRVTRTASCVHDLCVPLNHYRAVAEYSQVTGEGQGTAATIGREELAGQAPPPRDICGNPFHPSPELPTAVLGWGDRTVPRLAEGIYTEGAFSRLPILADALLDAGCDDDDLIVHCRGAGPHVRGCWAVDLILGKT